MQKLIARNTIKYNGKYLSPGTPFECDDDDEAQELIDLGAAELEQVEETSVEGQDPGNVVDKIVALIPDLDPETDFTANDVPKVDVLSERLGVDVTAEDRDEAVALIADAESQE